MDTNAPLIKICGIQSVELAESTALAGADYIGVVFHPESKRCVSINLAGEIAAAARTHGAKAVAIFVNHSADEMQQICEATDIDLVQLHGHLSRSQHHQLPTSHQRIYVQAVTANGELIADESGGLRHCDTQRDYLLVDTNQGGSGKSFNWHRFDYKTRFRLGLAGGLHPGNLAVALNIIKPQLVDISSGVENDSGNKDIVLIQQFIAAVKNTQLRGLP